MIHIEPIVLIARSFGKGKQFGDRYNAVMTITKVGTVGHCSGFMGKIGRDDYDQMLDALGEYGITELVGTRNGQERRYRINASDTINN